MKPVYLLLSLILCSCSSVARADGSQPVTRNEIVTINETATPSVNYQATAQSAQQAEQAAIDARLDAERAQLNAEQTAEAIEIERALVTQQAEYLAATVTAESREAQATSNAVIMDATATGQVVALRQTEANTALLHRSCIFCAGIGFSTEQRRLLPCFRQSKSELGYYRP